MSWQGAFLVAVIGTKTLDAIYIVAFSCFILALKALSSPKSARLGNWLGAAGMALALAFTLVALHIRHAELLAAGLVVGTVVGAGSARLVKMTAMPQMVAAFNGVGGAAAALVAITEYLRERPAMAEGRLVAVAFDVVIGVISFTGSAIAFGKLQEILPGRPVVYKAQQAVNAVLVAGAVGLAAYVLASGPSWALWGSAAAAGVFGVGFVLPIGGADAPVVISLLNSATGLAVAASGFVLQNPVLIVGGTLVGASGALLTRLMSQAMGRSLPNILFGAFGAVVMATGATEDAEGRTVRSASPEDVAMMLAYANQVMIVPGYGLAVAQAQHVVKELATVLEGRGVKVSFGIHPVAGRMPGHMNVLLAEADVPYEQLLELDAANAQLSSTDVVLVVGANDVVNPAARDSPGSPIYGMPILEVDQAKAVVFLKRSMRPGFAGIDNALLYSPKTTLLFGDAKDSLTKLVSAVKAA